MDNAELPFEIPPPRNRACDLCFAKKIKCDREDPCKHCVSIQAACIRARPKRRGNPDYERRKIAAAVRHASQLANASPAGPSGYDRKMDVDYYGKGHGNHDPHSLSRDFSRSGGPHSRQPGSPSPAYSPTGQMRRTSAPVHATFGQGQREPSGLHQRAGGPRRTDVDAPDVAGTQAQSYFESMLRSNQALDLGRREIVKSALGLVTKSTTQTAANAVDYDALDEMDADDYSIYPSAESLHFIIYGPARQQSVGLSYVLDMVTQAGFEKQGLALLEGTARAPARHHYAVNIGYAAFLVTLASIQSTPSPAMKEHLRLRLHQYEAMILRAVHHIGVLDPPSLSLLQSLLAGTLFMMHTGRIEKCYQLSCAASRTCVALGGRSYASFVSTLKKEDAVAARFCLTLCILYDKSLSLAMNRPSCLPDINLDASIITPLDPERPFTAIAHIYLELALVQDGIIRGQTGMTETRHMLDLVKTLQQKMWHVREKIRQGQARHPRVEDAYLYGEYIGTDFVYHSIMTSIVRLHPNLSDDPAVLEQMLGYARAAMTLLVDMINHGSSLTNMHTLTISIVWVLLCYPLSPFFILFCNVINCSELSDFELLTEVTDKLNEFEKTDKAVAGLCRLFEKFLLLCKPLIEKQLKLESPQVPEQSLQDVPRPPGDLGGNDRNGHGHSGVSANPPANMFRKPPMHASLDPNALMTGMGQQPMAPYPPNDHQMGPPMGNGQVYDPMTHINSLGEEDLLMHLGNAQPSLEWIDCSWPS